MKMKKPEAYVPFDVAVDAIMRAYGVSRRQAHAQLTEWCRAGKVRAVTMDPETGDDEPIAPERFLKIN